MAKISRKDLKKDEFVEAAFDLSHWLEENWRALLRVVVPVLVVAAAVAVWIGVSARAGERNRKQLALAMHEYQKIEQDGFIDLDRLAGVLDAFETGADKLGGSPAGQVARYYRGVTLHKLGRTDEAIEALESVETEADLPTLSAAKTLLANLLVESGQSERAVSLLEELAKGETAYPADMALLQLGRIRRDQGSEEEARATWSRVVDEYPDGVAAQEASRLLGS
jgi:tetratricopeptide (TPR) repeat protein